MKIGEIYGQLTVIKPNIKCDGRHSYSLCKCVCGNECVKRNDSLKSSKNPSCGCAYSNSYSNAGRKYKVGDKIGLLTIIETVNHEEDRHTWYKCKCDCGEICEVRNDCFTSVANPSCGCTYTNRKNIKEGDKFGLLTVLQPYIHNDGKHSWHKCLCECGNIVDARGDSLKKGTIKSCGCVLSYGERSIREILDKNNIAYK